MTGRNRHSREELEACRDNVDALLAAWQSNEVDDATLESLVFGQAVIALDAWFGHRPSDVQGRDVDALVEVRVLADSIIGNGGTLRVRDSTPWASERTVLGLEVGDDVVVTADGYERLAAAYFAALERAFLEPHD